MISKLMICPWFGPLPEWITSYDSNISRRLRSNDYRFLWWSDLDAFKERVKQTLGIDCPITPGSSKIHDYRAAFGVIFAEELAGYDFWGHTDFDCVYGRVEEFVTDAFLADLDIHSNHHNYVAGPWSLYRNVPLVNTLFIEHSRWREILENPETLGWVETDFTQIVDARHEAGDLRRAYTMWQTRNLDDFTACYWDGDRLMESDEERMMLHFRRTKEYPEQLK